MGRKYELPAFLVGTVEQAAYERWLRRRAVAHVKRDRRRGNIEAIGEAYRVAIHAAVFASGGRDQYTGEPLNWSRISTYKNEDSKAGRRGYKAGFAMLPTVDHVGDGLGPADFKICSWRTNDAKADLSHEQFLALCRAVVAHADGGRSRPEDEDGDVAARLQDLRRRGFGVTTSSDRVDPLTVELWGGAISFAIRGRRDALARRLEAHWEVTPDCAEFLAALIKQKEGRHRPAIPKKFRDLQKFDHPLYVPMVMFELEKIRWRKEHPDEPFPSEETKGQIADDFEDVISGMERQPAKKPKKKKGPPKEKRDPPTSFDRLDVELKRSSKKGRRLI